ncbi:deoxynucleotidyltransferase terminal-interacting protein 2-like [Convolutriloba macropyga]|uniref:deoxynucleotidyltransferase terminal-interacting protein 2-like n=1 Tax=Convolutriloba macropyga TaxID=536237 RepID=UPI003F526329
MQFAHSRIIMPSINDDELCSATFVKIKEVFGSRGISAGDLQSDILSFKTQKLTELDPGITIESYLDFDNPLDPTANRPTPLNDTIKEVLSKSILNDPNFYKSEPSNVYKSKRAIKKLRQEVREKTAGKNWFYFKSHELEDEDVVDRELMRMRDVIYGKKIYKRGALRRENQSKFVQIGTWKRSPLDHYSKEFSAKKSKKSLVETLLADADFKKQNRDKYLEMVKKRSNYKRISQLGKPDKSKAETRMRNTKVLSAPNSGDRGSHSYTGKNKRQFKRT